MKFKKISAVAAVVAAMSMMAVSASAADWSKTGYADDDPTTVELISTSADGITFTQQVPGGSCKARITLIDILENPEDVSKIYSGSWTVTYHGLSSLSGTEIGWLGGGTYCATTNSAGFGLSPTEWNEDGTVVWEDEQSVEDSFKYLLPSHVPAAADEAEFVFMDWSGQDLVANGITLTISDFKIFDKDGNEIPQKAYGAAEDVAPAEEAPAVEEAPAAEEAPAVEEAPASDDTASESAPAPAADNTTTSTSTGNASAAAIAGVMAVAAAAAVVSKKRN